MSAELFSVYSEWLFDVLSEIEQNVDFKLYSQQMYRTPGTISERLFGIFITYLEMQKKYKIKYQQLIFWNDTERTVELLPYFSKNNIAIASNFNNNYVPVFSVLLKSIISHITAKNNYDIIVFSMDITKANKEILSAIADKPNVSLRFFNPSRYFIDTSLYVANSVYTSDMYVRVLIPHILSAYEKVLVLDADMICMKDLAPLYMTDLGDCWAGAVKDVVYCGYLNGVVPDTLEYAKKILRLSSPYSYCNTGVILFNCTKIRDNFSLPYLQNYISTHKYRVYEQDTLNVLLDKHFYFLNRGWNVYTYTSDFIKKCVQYAPYADKEEYLIAREHPRIIHYAAHPKPWWVGNGDFSVEFWRYARQSPYYEMILAGMIKQLASQTGSCQPQYIIPPYKSLPRKAADVLLPMGSKRRNLAKKILPKGSRRWNVLKKIYNRVMHIC